MVRMTFVILLVLAAVCATMADVLPKPLPKPAPNCCGKNEVWTKCGNACSEPQCNPRKDIVCPAVCQERCVCKKGWLRNKHGKCVEPCDC
ncbi:hypothetical protein KPH14_011411 [Odynerus spinipes]|uniref:TIL domain-containing protein n=1 Tax=Odynerus spinipes TaxID=1348599 RepID=A0AAD9VTU3_9HYME|nr:hypothetical protein KPH14_011411 [Odynerus spinipes]